MAGRELIDNDVGPVSGQRQLRHSDALIRADVLPQITDYCGVATDCPHRVRYRMGALGHDQAKIKQNP